MDHSVPFLAYRDQLDARLKELRRKQMSESIMYGGGLQSDRSRADLLQAEIKGLSTALDLLKPFLRPKTVVLGPSLQYGPPELRVFRGERVVLTLVDYREEEDMEARGILIMHGEHTDNMLKLETNQEFEEAIDRLAVMTSLSALELISVTDFLEELKYQEA